MEEARELLPGRWNRMRRGAGGEVGGMEGRNSLLRGMRERLVAEELHRFVCQVEGGGGLS